MRFSIVIPTHERRATVVRNVIALGYQTHRDFEVFVVVDGSADGTADAIRSLEAPFPLTVISQPRSGAGQARNAGAAAASGELLLFLDDDMKADPALLLEHERSHREGADVVLGDLPLDPASPANLLSRAVGAWARARRERLANGAGVRMDDLITGQLSISRETFERLGGFDAGFTRFGRFGGEDLDLGCRVRRDGCRVVFNPAAISHQYYDVDPAAYLHRARDAGRAVQELVLKHPEQAEQLTRGPRFHTRRSRWLLGPLAVAPPALSRPLTGGVAWLVRSGRGGVRLIRLFQAVRTMEHLRGRRLARRALWRGQAVVLAYHSIADLRDDRVLARYGVPGPRFADHLDALVSRGWTFVALDRLLEALDGRERLPPRAILLTFDDGYVDLLETGLPILAERRIPALAFAVAGRVGGENEWDRATGARRLDLLDAEGLRTMAAHDVEVGSHGSCHRLLTEVAEHELPEELQGSAAQLKALGLRRPRAFSYPYGQWSPQLAAAVRRAGYACAFTVEPDVVRRPSNLHALPRIEVLASDTSRCLRIKIATAGWPTRHRTRLLRLLRVPL